MTEEQLIELLRKMRAGSNNYVEYLRGAADALETIGDIPGAKRVRSLQIQVLLKGGSVVLAYLADADRALASTQGVE